MKQMLTQRKHYHVHRQKIIDPEGDSAIMTKVSQNIKILTVQEVANLLRVHRSTVSRYAKSGELRSYRIGNRRLFREDDVWSFFDNQVAQNCVSGKEMYHGNSSYPET